MRISMIMAVSADGKIAQSSQELIDWTSPEDKKFFVELTKSAGVVVFGRTTYETIGKPLKERLIITLTSTPAKYASIPGHVEFHDYAQLRELIRELEKRGFEHLIVAGGTQTNTAFLELGLIDEIYLTIEPIIFGKGLNLADALPHPLALRLVESRLLNENTIMLHYLVKK